VTGISSAPAAPFGEKENSLITGEFRATLSVLLIDDERTLRESCRSILTALGYRVEVASKGDEGLKLLQRRAFDIVITDLYLPDVTGVELCQAALERSPETLVVVMTGNPSVASNVEVLRAGAWDYLPKPFSATHLEILIGRAAHTVMVSRESGRDSESRSTEREDDAPLGASPGFLRCLDLARKVAATDASVFITGETGTGKEMIAQFIHKLSRRRRRPIVAVNCAAFPEGLLESEMFGHVRGSFTGAVRDKAGLLESANGGTMFLDELTEMPKSLQAKLLRVIQDGVVRRVGSNDTVVVNVRFIAASNRDADTAVREGALREDLYYRLRVVPISIPPLRERAPDIELLAGHFLKQYWLQHRGGDPRVPTLGPEALRELTAQDWPGNVRELQNALEHSVVLLEPGQVVRAGEIPLRGGTARHENSDASFEVGGDLLKESYHVARDRVVAQFERRYIESLVAAAEGNMSKAARIAGVDRTTLYRLMERQGLQRAAVVGPNPS